ncbi:MAG: OmpA family protein [Paludibacteraceae bacterium]|nr:OmpA family protein [Paludibacteraceae bacterium]
MVDADGCPLDSDNDGVPDYLDHCITSPEEIPYVDSLGCNKDSDHDGVPDYIDKCPDTDSAAVAFVDSLGCDKDSDRDGIPDYLDKCPDTDSAAVAFVDSLGCNKDSDNDSVPDYLDECPTIPGPAINKGCPVIQKTVRNLFKKAMQGIQFETGKAVIKKSSYGIMDDIAKVFLDNPTYMAEVQGHTDNTGSENVNKKLSQSRADAVRNYLIKAGVPEAHLTAVGYGSDKPIADNTTKEGRAQNRRVEFDITFEQVTYEDVFDHAETNN